MSPTLSCTRFSGSEDVHVWLRQFGCLATSLGWSDQQTLYRACACFVGSAADWLDTIQLSSWDYLKDALIHRFADGPQLLASKLFACAQFGYEDVAAYADRLQCLAARLKQSHSHIPPCLLLRQFIQGLCQHLRSAVVMHHPEDLADAVDFATYFEQSHDLSQSESSGRHRAKAYGDYADFSPQQQDILPVNQPQPYVHRPQPHLCSGRSSSYAAYAHCEESANRVQQLQHQLADLRIQLSQIQANSASACSGEIIFSHESDYAEESACSDADLTQTVMCMMQTMMHMMQTVTHMMCMVVLCKQQTLIPAMMQLL